MPQFLLLVHLAATWHRVGLCWRVQGVQYPLMEEVGREGFTAHEVAHVAGIGPTVAWARGSRSTAAST
ncbi:MAG: hypothetical protein NXI30_00035 [bacterium]|nr:hypothetical protein [bacterium]